MQSRLGYLGLNGQSRISSECNLGLGAWVWVPENGHPRIPSETSLGVGTWAWVPDGPTITRLNLGPSRLFGDTTGFGVNPLEH